MPGTTDIGNHGDDTVTTIALPFSYALYDQTFTSINLSSNGNAQFTTTDTTFTNQCLPWTTHNYTIFPYWDDLYLVNSGFGIFTSISGTAPNRIFNIEWRAQYFPGSGSAGFELRLYEGQTRFDVIYGTVTNGNTSATAGVQKNDTAFDQYFCNGAGMPATGGQSYILTPCRSPTPTPTGTPPSPTPTATTSPTPTAPATATPTAPATATPTASPSCTPNYIFTAGTGTIVPGTTDTAQSFIRSMAQRPSRCTVVQRHTLTGNQALQRPTSSSQPRDLHFVSNDALCCTTNAATLPSATVLNMPYHAALGRTCAPIRLETSAAPTFGGSGLRGFHLGIGHGTQPNLQYRVEDGVLCGQRDAANFELRLYEGQSRFDLVYGEIAQTGSSATVGVQQGTGAQFTQFECNTAGT